MGKLILPGLIDSHVHLRDPGQTNKEDFYTGTCAAIAGGFTTILDMPNNKTPITTLDKLNKKIKIAKEKIVCDVGFYFGSMGDNLSEFKKVNPPAGGKALGLKLYLNQTTGNFLINKTVLEKTFISWGKKPILAHAEDNMLSVVIELIKKLGNKIHVCHISTMSDLKQIIKAKKNNLPITCGVTPHHLFLTGKDVEKLGPFGLMKPSLKSKRDQDFLWKNLKYIDVVESDHAPHTIGEKRGEVSPYGVPGLETNLPLLLTAASQNRLKIEDIVRLCHTNPAKIFGIKIDPQTKIEINLNTKYFILNTSQHTKCHWTPFNNWEVQGQVEKVFIRGKKVFENGKILAKKGSGKVIQQSNKLK